MSYERVGFIGSGQMAEAILRGGLEAGVLQKATIIASDLSAERRQLFSSLGARTSPDNLPVVNASDVVLIAVKPQNLDAVLNEIGDGLTERHLVLSICAGCDTKLFEAATPAAVRVVRAMPNLPMLVRMGATAICGGKRATPPDLGFAEKLFGAAGSVVRVAESQMDAVTAVSGSGPAYFYFLVEVLIQAGVKEGLSPEVARALAIQTARGAAETLVSGADSPEEMRRRVTSKGGTTFAAFEKLEEKKVREALLEAIAAARTRAAELGRQ